MNRHDSTIFNSIFIVFSLIEILNIMLIDKIRYSFFQRFVNRNVKRLNEIDTIKKKTKNDVIFNFLKICFIFDVF